MKLSYKKTFLLGFGFFAISLTWSIYNSFVPDFLRRFTESKFLIGFIMTLDNYAGLFLQPLFGSLSDRTHTKFGRRMPYLLIGMPFAAVIVCIIPLHWSMLSLIISIVALNLVMASFRSPTIALMPDLTPEPLRSKANGIINLMGGVGGALAFLAGSYLYKVNTAYPFYMASFFIILSIIILYFNIKEQRDSINYFDNQDTVEKDVPRVKKRGGRLDWNVIMLLLAIFSWFVGYNAVETFFTLYGKEYLHIGVDVAARKFFYFTVSMILFAVPSGLIATRIGKKKTILTGLALMILTFGGLQISKSINSMGYMFLLAGAFWALININSYPLVVSMTNDNNIGRYTGYYYLFSSLAAIVSPPFVGKLIDWWGYGILFKYSVIAFITAFMFMLLVKSPDKIKKTVQP